MAEEERHSRSPRHCKRRTLEPMHFFFMNKARPASPDDCRKKRDVDARLPGCDGQAAVSILRLNWRMLPDCSKFLNPNVQMFGYVGHVTDGQNHWQTLKIPWCFLNEIYMATLLLFCCGKDDLKKFYWNLGGERCRLENVCSFIENKGCFCQ